MIEGLQMLDAKAITGTFATGALASSSWLDVAEPIVTILMTLIVGGVTLWYTWERAAVLRAERKRREQRESTGGDVKRKSLK